MAEDTPGGHLVGQFLSMLGFKRDKKRATLDIDLAPQELAEADDLLSAYTTEISAVFQGKYEPKEFESGRRILESPPQVQLGVLLVAMARTLGLLPKSLLPKSQDGYSVDVRGVVH